MLELKAIFYARFHTERGPSVIEQHPADSIATRHAPADETNGTSVQNGKSLLSFSDVTSYIIPPYDLCGKGLSVCIGGYRIVGFPLSLESEAYSRNRFTFNVCFVLGESEHEEEDGGSDGVHQNGSEGTRGVALRSWEKIVQKTALFFQAMEVEDGILLDEESKNEVEEGSGTIVKSVLRKVHEQLTTYGEACVRVDKIHALNLRLEAKSSIPFPRQQKVKVHLHDVPLLIRPLPSKNEWTYDLVLARTQPHINGINHIARIAEKAEVQEKLVKRAVRGLVVLGRVRILDIFHYQAIYRLTADFSYFVRHEEMQEEGRKYVSISVTTNPAKESPTISQKHLFALYTSLSSYPSLHDFVLAHQSQLVGIDIRRFVTFGVLKGFLRRVHKYALAVASSSGTPQGKTSGSSGGKFGSGSGGKKSGESAEKEFERLWRKAALSSGWATPPTQVSWVDGDEGTADAGEGGSNVLAAERRISPEKTALRPTLVQEGGGVDREIGPEDEKLRSYLDGKHCFDAICVAMRMSETKVLDRLRSAEGRKVFGEVVVFCK